MRLTLLVMRTHDQVLASKISTCSDEFVKSSAIALLSTEDMEELGIRDGDCIELSFLDSKVVVKAYRREGLRRGYLIMPLSPWSMALLPPMLSRDGHPVYGRITVSVKPANCDITPLDSLIFS